MKSFRKTNKKQSEPMKMLASMMCEIIPNTLKSKLGDKLFNKLANWDGDLSKMESSSKFLEELFAGIDKEKN